MALTSSPIVRRQRLGAELRRMRKEHELTLDQVAERLGWASNSKVSRIEKGQNRPDLADIMDLLDLYHVTGAKREELIAVARDAANTRGWWRSIPGLRRQRAYAELEAGVAEIRQYQDFLVPGLLQIPDYTRIRVMSMRDLYSGLDPDTETRTRQVRQSTLTGDDPPLFESVIDEAALRRNVAPSEVMREQLTHLIDVIALPNVTIRVLPLSAKVADFYVPHSSFALYRFRDPLDPESVVLETLTSDVHLRDDEDLAMYKMVYSWLRDASLSPEETVKLIDTIASQF